MEKTKNAIIEAIREKLRLSADERTLSHSQHFFKETIKLYGVKTPVVRQISKELFKLTQSATKTEIFELCEILLQSGFIEESFIACHWSYAIHTDFKPEDFQLFERWVNEYINNWATCDTFCNHTLGAFIEMYPEYINQLKAFTKSDNRWVRRASAVTLIIPAKKGKFIKEILAIADILLFDQEDMVQKGYGWMLKVASEANQHDIFEYVMKNKAVMPRTALRYAIEKMPSDLKKMAMERTTR